MICMAAHSFVLYYHLNDVDYKDVCGEVTNKPFKFFL